MLSGTNTYYYLADGLGSTMAIVDATGAVQKWYTYDVYGEATAAGSLANELDFAGQQTDPTGLQYLRARYMDPETGTFTSREPLAAAIGWPGSHYTYAKGNPVRLTDSTGLLPDDFPGIPGPCDLLGPVQSVQKKVCGGVEEAVEKVSEVNLDPLVQGYIDANGTLILPPPIPMLPPIGVTVGCQNQVQDPALHCYAGVVAGSPGASVSVTAGPGQNITEGRGCGAQAGVTLPVGPVGVGPVVGGGAGGIDEKGGGSAYGEIGVTVSFPPGPTASAGCYYIGPNLLP